MIYEIPYYLSRSLGERPYNDQSLLSDSMIMEDYESFDDVERDELYGSEMHFSLKGKDEMFNLIEDIEEVTKDNLSSNSNTQPDSPCIPKNNLSSNSNTPSNSSCTPKNNTQCATDPSKTKKISLKKKKISDVRSVIIIKNIKRTATFWH